MQPRTGTTPCNLDYDAENRMVAVSSVGWVERSETQRHDRDRLCWVGGRPCPVNVKKQKPTNPTYQLVQEACTGCSARDQLIAAALAQNGSITPSQIAAMSNGGGGINWENFLNQPVAPGQMDAQIRQALSGIPYDRKFMLLLYIKDMRELYGRGWALPDGITEADLDTLEETAQN